MVGILLQTYFQTSNEKWGAQFLRAVFFVVYAAILIIFCGAGMNEWRMLDSCRGAN